ncbi:pyridoxamine 5'-phosphate oxidase family protein [Christensenellaceae bacterium OttesenSCG-928-K19]|nr:pyridoxamine 5'-phosphate oxidase family protein [Christensenellaceae bacterium OttesenSCG-928-K19]
MGFVMEYGGKLCFCTNNTKNMFKQMKANPKVEISGCAPDGKFIRITGTVSFVDGREAKEKALEALPALKAMYSPDDGMFEVIALEEGEAAFSDVRGNKTPVDLY